jgi:2-pyrone-4,6-dicarboxylate lactonase
MNSTVGFALPPNTTDCHAHVFDPERFPYVAERRYTPPPATAKDLRGVHTELGIARTVLVQPSVYGTDNRCLLSALESFGSQARGIAVIDASFSPSQLREMHDQGVRGARLNLHVDRQADPVKLKHQVLALSDQLGELPWLMQIYASLPSIVALCDTLSDMRRKVLLDHFGMVTAAAGTRQPGMAQLQDLLAREHIYIKLSGPYQISMQGPTYGDVAPIARALLGSAPRRAVWGSDWPHPGGAQRAADADPLLLEPFRQEDDAALLGMLKHCLPDQQARQQLLSLTPGALFDFDQHSVRS